MALAPHEWLDRFVTHLGVVIGSLVDVPVTVSPSKELPEDGWVVMLQGAQGARGTLSVEFDRNAIEIVTKRIIGLETEPPDEILIDTLKELCAQAAGSMVMEPPLAGMKLVIASVERGPGPGARTPSLVQIVVGDIATLRLRLWGEIAIEAAAAAQSISSTAKPTPKLDMILDIDLPLTVRFGRTEMPLRVITGLGPGSVIDLGRSPDDPVDLLISNRVIARGEVVIVGGNYGVRITDVTSPADRVRSLEGEI
jgi:flagellar motor switch protein FliN/FliY